MKIASMFQEGKTIFSFEVFPPKKTSPIETIYNTLDELEDLKPDFISVTYGAGGNVADTSTADIACAIRNKYHIEALAHLTCVNNSRDEIDAVLKNLRELGIENIMALRGDINPNVPPKHDFRYASELVAYIREHSSFHISGACYPECHVDSPSPKDDILHLKEKVDAGAEHLVSQLFFDNRFFYDFLERARSAGITVPIEAGIMPVVNKRQIERMVTLCGASLPPKFTKMMQRYENHPDAMRDAGIAYAVDQIIDLVSHGVDGIHLYTMNNPYVARRISESVESVIRLN
ncbi:methylenetetrahydrofolate reductase [NAD(P)H] [Anaerolentibacter hominis]|uniref:methylenetetrahydrofolate reductase [NAD(P)H] n=1 Tax=Anaerolentibacter hominis TaxID=3079009 RepID=UPI0031B86514